MGLAFREIPNVTKTKFSHLVTTIFVDGRNENAAKEDLPPFSLGEVSVAP
jgi:hypothetical protein